MVRKQRSTVCPGGAANTAANLAALGAKVAISGVVGADANAQELKTALNQASIDTFLVEDAARPTTTKTRVMALNQQVVRVDEEDTAPLPDRLADQVAAWVARELPQCQGLVISDYAKGFLTPVLLQTVIGLAGRQNCPVFVDPKGPDCQRYRGCILVKPNRLELSLLTGLPVRDHASTIAAGRALAASMQPAIVLVTEGADGMTAFSSAGETHADSLRRQVFDVTGAGDTVLAALALAICSGATLADAMALAVSRGLDRDRKSRDLGRNPRSSAAGIMAPVLSTDELLAQVEQWRAARFTIGFTCGAFDLLHAGHAHYLGGQQAPSRLCRTDAPPVCWSF